MKLFETTFFIVRFLKTKINLYHFPSFKVGIITKKNYINNLFWDGLSQDTPIQEIRYASNLLSETVNQVEW